MNGHIDWQVLFCFGVRVGGFFEQIQGLHALIIGVNSLAGTYSQAVFEEFDKVAAQQQLFFTQRALGKGKLRSSQIEGIISNGLGRFY